ncbi:hypothetical protein HN51_056319 [Arachis hypogaea]|uniref:SAP domain-containing protein n=1 Tax=Arachis hypogaea TaxID=3818 RepID=A0A6B9VFN6_ARAHY|nr:uncharacterized protein LOC112779073 [Arachis hypogaea]QHN79162.1 uncharacterized protein DS421_19g667750 [Arachis hypogaea]
MDLHAMKRKQLQSLCKKHGIPANLKNLEMAHRLSSILKEKEDFGACPNMSDVETNKLNSSHHDNDHHKVTTSDASEVNVISSLKRSASTDSEQTIGYSPKHHKNSEIKGLESQRNSTIPDSPRDEDAGACDMNNVDLAKVASVEYAKDLVVEEVAKLDDNSRVLHNCDNVNETRKGGDEAEKQYNRNMPQESTNTCEGILPSSQEPCPGADPVDSIGFFTKPHEASMVIEKLENFDNTNEVLPVPLYDSVKNNVNLVLQVSSQDNYVKGELHHKQDENIFVDHDIDQGKMELELLPKDFREVQSESMAFLPRPLNLQQSKGFQTKTSLTFESCDVKENMQRMEKEQDGMFISKGTSPKKQSLQEIHQE